jgi:hypothetical protein
MDRGSTKNFQTTVSRQNWIFNLFLSLCILFGILFILISVIWKQHSHDRGQRLSLFQLGQSVSGASNSRPIAELVSELLTDSEGYSGLGPDVLRDLGIALLISAFVTFSIERYASNRLREHITYDVLSAAYAKVVPEKIYTQVADNVFRSDVYRRNWEVHIDSTAERLDKTNGIAIITSTYSYELENLNESPIPFTISAGVDLDVPSPNADIPRFNSFVITDEHNKALVDQREVHDLLQRPPAGVGSVERGGNLALRRDSEVLRIDAQVKMPARRSVTVRYQVERAIRVPGNYILSATGPADGIKIIVSVRGFKLTVVPLHPNRDALRHPQEDTWLFDAGILPWQSFRFTSEILNNLGDSNQL